MLPLRCLAESLGEVCPRDKSIENELIREINTDVIGEHRRGVINEPSVQTKNVR